MAACSTAREKAGLVPIICERRRPAPAAAYSPPADSTLRERIFQRQQDTFAAQRFFEEIERSRAGGLHRVRNGGVAGDHDHRARHVRCRPAQQIDAVAVGQLDVQKIRRRRAALPE